MTVYHTITVLYAYEIFKFPNMQDKCHITDNSSCRPPITSTIYNTHKTHKLLPISLKYGKDQNFVFVSFDYTDFAVSEKVEIPETGLTTPVGWLSLLQLSVLSCFAIVV